MSASDQKDEKPRASGWAEETIARAKFGEYPCRCCSVRTSTHFAVNNIPEHGHLCTPCYDKILPHQMKQFYVRKPL